MFGNKASATSAVASVATAAPAASTPIAPAVENKLEAPAKSVANSASAVASSASAKSTGSSNSLTNVVNNAVGDVAGMVKSLSSNGAGLSVKAAEPNTGFCSEGSNGPYVVQAKNNKNTDMMLVIWNANNGYSSSFVGKGVQAPVMTVVIGAGKTQAISFQSGASGSMAPVWSSTAPTTMGQISNTWLEFTFSPTGVVDVSREVDMGGDSIATTVGSNGCKSDMQTCSFQCVDGSNSCVDSYQLKNCDANSMPGAQSSSTGKDGGCGWLGASSETIQAVFG